MTTRKGILATLSVAVLMSLALSACAAPAPKTAAPAETGTEQKAAEPAQPTEAVELTMWTWKIFHVPGLEAIAKNFKDKTGITVKISAFNPDEVYRTKITTSAQSGDLPDILSYWSGGQWEMAATDLLVELTDQVDAAWQKDFLAGTFDKRSVMTQDVFDTCQKDPKCTFKNINVGQSFSVPYLAGQAWFIFGNKAILTEAGLDPDKPPANADEWLEMMKTVKAKTGKAGLVTGVQNPDVMHYWLFNPMLMTSCGVETYDAIYNGGDSFANPCALKVFNWINELAVNDLWTPEILQTNIDPADVAFTQGKAAFDLGGTYTLGFLLSQGMKAEDILSFALPTLPGGAYEKLQISAFPLIDAMVTKNSKHQKPALEFLRFMTSPDQMALFAKTTGDFPAVKVSSDPEKVGNVMPGLIAAFADTSPFNDSKAEILEAPGKVLKIGLQQFITKETTPADLVKAIDEANKAAWDERGGPKQ